MCRVSVTANNDGFRQQEKIKLNKSWIVSSDACAWDCDGLLPILYRKETDKEQQRTRNEPILVLS